MRLIIMAAIGSLFACAAFAQGLAVQNGPTNAPVKAMDQNIASVPVRGKNSFTMDQAKSAIENRGYTSVAGLTLDQDGIWRGTASKDGRTGPVSLDYQGNVN